MSQNPGNVTHNEDKHFDMLKVIALALGLASLLIIPLGLYAIGQLFAVHVAFSDLSSGFSQAGFYQIVYNSTHVNEYSQMAQLSQGESISIASQDQSDIPLFMLGIGIMADIPLAFKLRQWLAEL
jgi:hypothetical protein